MRLNEPRFFRSILALFSLPIFLSGCLQSKPVERSIATLSIDTPSAGWEATPLEAWETEEAIYCLFQLIPPTGMSAQVITPIVSEMQLPASTKKKKLVALGKTWKWSSDDNVDFPDSHEAFKNSLADGARRIEPLLPDA